MFMPDIDLIELTDPIYSLGEKIIILCTLAKFNRHHYECLRFCRLSFYRLNFKIFLQTKLSSRF